MINGCGEISTGFLYNILVKIKQTINNANISPLIFKSSGIWTIYLIFRGLPRNYGCKDEEQGETEIYFKELVHMIAEASKF